MNPLTDFPLIPLDLTVGGALAEVVTPDFHSDPTTSMLPIADRMPAVPLCKSTGAWLCRDGGRSWTDLVGELLCFGLLMNGFVLVVTQFREIARIVTRKVDSHMSPRPPKSDSRVRLAMLLDAPSNARGEFGRLAALRDGVRASISGGRFFE
jgi:hypothetical protein